MRHLFSKFLVSAFYLCFLLYGTVSCSSSAPNSNKASIPDISFTLSLDMAAQIVPHDPATNSYKLPQTPSVPTITKLVYFLDSNAKKIGMVTFVVKQFTHYDPMSEELFKSAVESFPTLASLHKSIKYSPTPEFYSKVSESLTELLRILMTFLRAFTSSLLVPRLSEVEAYRNLLFDFKNLEGMFYFAAHSGIESFPEIMTNLIFSSVQSVQDERLIWDFYKRFASPSNCLPLPHEFLVQGLSREIYLSLVTDLLSILTSDKDLEESVEFDMAWLVQLGLLIRFRLVSLMQAVELAEQMVVYNWGNSVADCSNFMIGIRFIFLDKLVQSSHDKTTVNFSNQPAPVYDSEDLKLFYIKMWAIIVSKPNFDDTESFQEFMDTLNVILYQLDFKFPRIIDDLDLEGSDDPFKFLEFINLFNRLNMEFVSQVLVDKIAGLFGTIVLAELESLTIHSLRYKLSFIVFILAKVIQNINKCLPSPTLNFVNLINAIEKAISEIEVVGVFAPEFSEESEVILFVDFAFKLTEYSQAQVFINYALHRIGSNPQLLSTFFSNFARNLLLRPDFFCLSFDPKEEARHFNASILDPFFDALIQVSCSGPLLEFVASAYLFGYLDHNRLWLFLDNLESIDGSEIFNVAASITDISSFELIVNDQSDAFDLKIPEFQLNTVKMFNLFLRFESEELDTKYLPWICFTLASFESLKPQILEADQLTRFDELESSDLAFEDSAVISLQLISELINTGASQNDLKRVMIFVQNLRAKLIEATVNQPKKNIIVSTTLSLLVLIIRANESIVPIEFATEAMNFYNMVFHRFSAPQIIYKCFKDPGTRSQLIPDLFGLSFDRIDFAFLHDPTLFEGMAENVAEEHMKTFLQAAFISNGARLEVFCFWMSRGLVPLEIAQDLIQKIGHVNGVPVAMKHSISLLRVIFRNEKYRPIRTIATKTFFMKVDHTAYAPRPLMLGIVGGVADLAGEQEFIAAIDTSSPNYLDTFAILQNELARKERVRSNSLYLADGIENVTETYILHLTQLATFDMALVTKVRVFDSIFDNLTRITSSQHYNLDCIFTEVLLDDFVRVSVHLAAQIYFDFTAPMYSFELDSHSFEILFEAIVQYVRDVGVQSLLIYHIFSSIKDQQTTRDTALQVLPRYMNWRRFLVLPDTFQFIFNFNGPVESFDQFMVAIIDSAFDFSNLSDSDAADLSRDSKQFTLVHEAFFSTMAFLISQSNLPVKYTLRALKLLNLYPLNVEINSSSLIQFLRAAIATRIIDKKSTEFEITKQSYGDNPSYNSQEETYVEVLAFLNKRPDFLTVAFVNERGSESFKLIQEIDILNRKFPSVSYNLPAFQLIRAIFIWPLGGLESLELISRVELQNSTIRSIVSWIAMASPRTGENVIPIAMFVLKIVPVTFDVDLFLESTVSQSWMPIASSIVDWITHLVTEFPRKFASKLEERAINAYLNILLWSLECDYKEKSVGKAFVRFLQSIVYASESIKLHLIQTLSEPYFLQILIVLHNSSTIFFDICSVFRTITLNNRNLANNVEKLSTEVLKTKTSVDEETITAQRKVMIYYYEQLGNLNAVSNLREFLVDLCTGLLQLQSMNQFDLIFQAFNKLSALTKELVSHEHSKRLEDIAWSIQAIVSMLKFVLLLQADFDIFMNLFRFLFRHAALCIGSKFHETIGILLSQFTNSTDIRAVLSEIISNLRLNICLIPSYGLPKPFYSEMMVMADPGMFASLYFDNLNQLNHMQRAQGTFSLDGAHLITLFNILHAINASDELFKIWIENLSRFDQNKLLTELFAENLKAHCLTRRHLIKDLIPVLIKAPFVTKVFNSCGTEKQNMLAVFKLMYTDSPQAYQNQFIILPVDLQRLMNEAVGVAVNEKKRKLIEDLVNRCVLPSKSDFKIEELSESLKTNLETVLKLDLSLLSSELATQFFNRLQALLDGLAYNILFCTHTQYLTLISIALAIQIKNGIVFDPSTVIMVLRAYKVLDVKQEVFELVARETAKLDCAFAFDDSVAVIGILAKVSDPQSMFIQFLNNRNIGSYDLIKLAFGVYKMKLDFSQILPNQIAKLALESTFPRDKLIHLVQMAKEQKLLSKTQILAIDRFLK